MLISILKNNGDSAKFWDLNINLIEYLKQSSFLFDFVSFGDNLSAKNIEDIFGFNSIENFKIKWTEIKKNVENLYENLDFITYVLKEKTFFYNPIVLSYSLDILIKGLASLSFFDSIFIEKLIPKISEYRSSSIDKDFFIDTNELENYINSEFVFLREYYKTEIKKIELLNISCIGISIGLPSQFVPAMILGYLIKKKTSIHVNFAGSFFSSIYKDIKNIGDFLGKFCDSISYGDNEHTVTQLLDFIKKRSSIDSIENLIYKKQDKIFINGAKSKEKINYDLYPSFLEYTKVDYLLPELVIPLKASVGCYWGKCIFCMCSASDIEYSIKPVNKLVDEIEFLSTKYNTKYFYFWDNAIPPEYLSQMADLLISKKIKIVYSMYARFDEKFDAFLLKKLRRTGCIEIYWGLESTSESVLEYINKGINPQTAKNVLKNSYKVGISNKVYYILGLPTETIEEAKKNILFSKSIKKYIARFLVLPECLFMNGSIMSQNKQFYMKEMLLTKREKSIIAEEILKLQIKEFNSIFTYNVYYILLLKHYGIHCLLALLKVCDFLMKNKFFLDKYINIHKILYYNLLKK